MARPEKPAAEEEPVGSLVTQAFMLEKYGPRLNTENLAELLGIKPSSVLNMVSCGTFPIPTYLDCGRRYADYRDAAKHFDECRARAGLRV